MLMKGQTSRSWIPLGHDGKFFTGTRAVKQYLRNYILCSLYLLGLMFCEDASISTTICLTNLLYSNVQNKWHSLSMNLIGKATTENRDLCLIKLHNTFYITSESTTMHFTIYSLQKSLIEFLLCGSHCAKKGKKRHRNSYSWPKVGLALGITWKRSDVFRLAWEILH